MVESKEFSPEDKRELERIVKESDFYQREAQAQEEERKAEEERRKQRQREQWMLPKEVHSIADKDSNRRISEDEVNAVSSFEHIDKNGDGKINKEEARQHVLAMSDNNRDGKLSLGEIETPLESGAAALAYEKRLQEIVARDPDALNVICEVNRELRIQAEDEESKKSPRPTPASNVSSKAVVVPSK